MNNIWYGENKQNRTRSSVLMHTKTPSVTNQGNITWMRYRNDVIRSVLLHVRANLSKMLARDYASCHATRSTLVILVANNVKTLRCPAFKSYRPLVGPIETQGSCTAAATKSQGAHACYSSDVCGHSTTVYSQTQFINEYTVPCCRCYTRRMYNALKRNQIRRD